MTARSASEHVTSLPAFHEARSELGETVSETLKSSIHVRHRRRPEGTHRATIVLRMTPAWRGLFALPALIGCGGAPASHPTPAVVPGAGESKARAAPRVDPCAGDASAAPLGFQGLLSGARCQAEVAEIMTETARALGVSCDHCHVRGDFARATARKEVANWMATKLSPSLRLRGGGAVSCADCHAPDGRGVAKILGAPRRQDRSVEWMTTFLSERFETASGTPLYCRTCHLENVGQTGFLKAVILTDHLPARASPPAGTDG
jgi:hypothetical protein